MFQSIGKLLYLVSKLYCTSGINNLTLNISLTSITSHSSYQFTNGVHTCISPFVYVGHATAN